MTSRWAYRSPSTAKSAPSSRSSSANVASQPGGRGQVGEVPGGDRDHHDPLAVAGREVTGEAAVEMVADPGPVGAGQLGLGQEAEMPGHRQRDVLQGQRDPAAFPGEPPAPLGGQQADRGVEPARHVPGGQHVVHRPLVPLGTGDQREPEPGVDGVVDGGAPVVVAQYLQVDQVGPGLDQVVVAEPGPADRVGQHDPAARPGGGHQVGQEALALGVAEVQRDRLLALVQPGPVDAGPGRGQGPAVLVARAADRVDPDDLGTELGQGQAAQRRGHEAGDLQDPEPVQRRSTHWGEALAGRRFRSSAVSSPVETSSRASSSRARGPRSPGAPSRA